MYLSGTDILKALNDKLKRKEKYAFKFLRTSYKYIYEKKLILADRFFNSFYNRYLINFYNYFRCRRWYVKNCTKQ